MALIVALWVLLLGLCFCLSDAGFSGADLNGTDLRDVNLEGAKVTSEQLAQAESLRGATMPDGSLHKCRGQTWQFLAVQSLVVAAHL